MILKNYWEKAVSFKEYMEIAKQRLENPKNDAEKALSLNPNNPLALGIRSIVRFEENDFIGATADADKALQLNPNSFLSYMAKGFIKGSTKRADGTYDHNAALEEFDKAYKLAPNDRWVKERRYAASKNLNSPLAKQIQEEMKKDALATATVRLEKAKQKVAENIWDFIAYDELKDAFLKADSNDAKAFWEDLIAKNPKNICAIRFLGEYKGGNYFMDMIYFLDDGLRLFDGKNGAECAAQIAFRIGREYNSRHRFEEATTYFNKAKAIKPDLRYLDQWSK